MKAQRVSRGDDSAATLLGLQAARAEADVVGRSLLGARSEAGRALAAFNFYLDDVFVGNALRIHDFRLVGLYKTGWFDKAWCGWRDVSAVWAVGSAREECDRAAERRRDKWARRRLPLWLTVVWIERPSASTPEPDPHWQALLSIACQGRGAPAADDFHNAEAVGTF
jgi:hypothetical protein